ncbi:fluoride efflux transporter FluC [Salinicoccus halodurans]|uniref:Fluoride-specific ion channel FluC n=1 Tax=Salinicoccus halodurans TaxID=407035 RepID=A0A0F7HL90_9STAP|nr:CrcB family protein [Salinicoccus halodurans]AKG74328.1 hypothetical protein AAT16_08840 [Salinicoccus halodurans]SFK94596.1 camphor resistance protein CrcB [Salinicoccus halodurans]
MTLFILAAGAALGAVLRAVILDFKIFKQLNIPYGTVTINITGSFLMGICAPLLQTSSMLYTLMIFGFLGGFTTYSAFSLDQLSLLREKRYNELFKYSFITIFFSLVALALGLLIGVSVA